MSIYLMAEGVKILPILNIEAETENELRAIMLQNLFSFASNAFVAQMTTLAVTVFIFWRQSSTTVLLFWAATQVVLLICRVLIATKYDLDAILSNRQMLQRWEYLAVLYGILGSIGWAVGFFLLPIDNLVYQLLYCFMVIMIIIGSLMVTSLHKPSFLVYTSICSVSAILWFFSQGTYEHILVSVINLLILLYTIYFGYSLHALRKNNMQIGLQYRTQATILSKEKTLTESLNKELKIQSQSLARSEARYRALSEASFEGIAIHENGIITDANDAVCEIFNYSMEEFIGKDIFELAHETSYDIAFQHMREDNEDPYEIIGIRSDGSHFPLEIQAKTLDSDEQTVRIVAVRDLTFRKQAEQDAIALELEHERIKLLVNFFQNISHEFRTPITIIKNANYMLTRLDDIEKRNQQLDKIDSQVNRVNKLVDEMLFMVRLDTEAVTQKEKFDVNTLIQLLITEKQVLLDAKMQALSLDLDNSVMDILADRELIKRAIGAILDNAIRYTAEHGKIVINTRHNDGQLIIKITDNGIGIEEDVMPYIFDRFFRVDIAHSTAGFGIGLSIAKRVVELHGGTIHATSTLGEGSVFEIHLPTN